MLAELTFNLPVMSAIMMLIAGVLLGYALWFPLRGDSEAISRRLNELRDQNDDLHSALRKNRESYSSLERKYAQQCDELTALQVASRRVESKLEQQTSVHSDLTSGVETIRELKQSAMKQLDLEREAKLALEAQLRKTNETAKQTIEQHRVEQQKLEDKVAQMSTALHFAEDQLVRSNAEIRSRSAVEMELADRREQCSALSEALEQSRSEQVALREQLQEITSHQSEQEVLQEQVKGAEELAHQLRTKHEDYANLQSKYDALLSELDSTKNSGEALAMERDHLLAEVNEKRESLTAAERLITSSIASQDSSESRVHAMESEIENLQKRVDALLEDRDDVSEELKLQQEQNLEMQARIQQQQKQLAEVNGLSRDSESQRESMEQEVSQLRAQLQRTMAERDDALAELDESKNQVARVTEHVQSLRTDLAHHQRAIDTIERQRAKTTESISSQQTRQTELEGLVEQQETTIEGLRQEAIEVVAVRHQCIALQTQLQDRDAQLRATRLDRDEMAAELTQGKDQWSAMEKRIQSYQQDLDRVRDQREELMNSLNGEKTRNEELSLALTEQTQRLELLGQNISRVEPMEAEIASLRSQLEDVNSKMSQVISERDEAEQFAAEVDEALQAARDELAETRQAIVALERDRDEVLGRLRRQNVMIESHLAKTDHEAELQNVTIHGGHEQPELMRRDERRGLVYTETPVEKDDLKLISGVAEVLERRLNEFGIYTYRQIMDWDPTAVEEFSKLLAFRDRIVRDNWLGQATSLYEKKYGRAA